MSLFQPLHLGNATINGNIFDLNGVNVFKDYAFDHSLLGELVSRGDVTAITSIITDSVGLQGDNITTLFADVATLNAKTLNLPTADVLSTIFSSAGDIATLQQQVVTQSTEIRLLQYQLQALFNQFGLGHYIPVSPEVNVEMPTIAAGSGGTGGFPAV